MAQYNKSDLERRMAGAIEALKGDLTESTQTTAESLFTDCDALTILEPAPVIT